MNEPKNVYVEVEYTSHQIKETYGEVERYYETCVEWFRDVIADEEVIDIEEMFMDHIRLRRTLVRRKCLVRTQLFHHRLPLNRTNGSRQQT
jgi:hypothetical protein